LFDLVDGLVVLEVEVAYFCYDVDAVLVVFEAVGFCFG